MTACAIPVRSMAAFTLATSPVRLKATTDIRAARQPRRSANQRHTPQGSPGRTLTAHLSYGEPSPRTGGTVVVPKSL